MNVQHPKLQDVNVRQAIRYAVDAPLEELRACHCSDCQRASGAHGAVVAFVRAENFRLVRGTPRRYAKKAAQG